MYITITGQHSLMDRGKAPSILYAVVLIIFGVVWPIIEELKTQWGTNYRYVLYPVFLQGASMIFIFSLEIYLFVTRKQRRLARTGHYDVKASRDRHHGDTDSVHNRKSVLDDMPDVGAESQTSRDPNEDASFERSEIYLPIGAALFGLGSMVYDAIRLKSVIECPASITGSLKRIAWPIIIQMVFILFQMYFIIKHPKLRLVRHETMVRIGLMHLLATNVCTWVRTVIRETHDLALWRVKVINNDTPVDCQIDQRLDVQAVAFLYPIVIQYLIIGTAAAFSVWATLQTEGTPNGKQTNYPFRLTDLSLDKANKGLFTGLVIIAGTIISIILFFFYLQADASKSQLLYLATDGFILIIILIIVLIGWTRFRTLAREPIRGAPTIRALLLVIAMIGFIAFNLLRAVSAFRALEAGSTDINRIMEFVVATVSVAAAAGQTLFIIDAMKRRCVSDREFLKKPGRGCATFLLLSNLALWLFRIFQLKVVFLDFEYHEGFYTNLWWRLIVMATVPLAIFYHFQASACLGFVWTHPYFKAPSDESFTMRSASQEIAAIFKGDSLPKLAYENPYKEYPGQDSTLPWVRAVMRKNKSLERLEGFERPRPVSAHSHNGRKRHSRPVSSHQMEYEYDTSAHLYRRYPSEPNVEGEEGNYAIPPDHRRAGSNPRDSGPPGFYGRLPHEQMYENNLHAREERPQVHHLPGDHNTNVTSKASDSGRDSTGRRKHHSHILEDPDMKASDV